MKMQKRVRLYREWRNSCECDRDYSYVPKDVFSDVAPCPNCKSKMIYMCDPIINSVFANFFLACGECGYEGPIGERECCAFSAWGII